MNKKFFIGVSLILTLYTIITWSLYTIFSLGEAEVRSFIFSGIIATVNIVVVLFTIKFSQMENGQKFNKRFLISLTFRFIILFAAIIFVIKFGKIQNFTFLSSLFVLYFTYQIWEVYFLNQDFNKGNEPV